MYLYRGVGAKFDHKIDLELLLRADGGEEIDLLPRMFRSSDITCGSLVRSHEPRVRHLVEGLAGLPARIVEAQSTQGSYETFAFFQLEALGSFIQMGTQEPELDPQCLPSFCQVIGAPFLSEYVTMQEGLSNGLLTGLADELRFPPITHETPRLLKEDTQPSPWPSLPADVQYIIFNLVRDIEENDLFPPWWISFHYPTTSNLRCLAGLSLVCRGWHDMATRALLRFVPLRVTRKNVNSLITKLTSPLSPSNSTYLKSLHISFPWSTAGLSDEDTAELLTPILQLATDISQLFFDNVTASFSRKRLLLDVLEELAPTTLGTFGFRGIGLMRRPPGYRYNLGPDWGEKPLRLPPIDAP
ncbi:hypothetical protein FRC17_004618, partial [Serendipita sp. 399]